MSNVSPVGAYREEVMAWYWMWGRQARAYMRMHIRQQVVSGFVDAGYCLDRME